MLSSLKERPITVKVAQNRQEPLKLFLFPSNKYFEQKQVDEQINDDRKQET